MMAVGLTGGIACGKSTAANVFKNLGITVIDADELAHELTKPDKKYFNQIITHFGPSYRLSNGTLNRQLLKKTIFENEIERAWLEKILHPPIIQTMQQAIESAQSKYCIVVVPLLLEKNLQHLFDRILVIDASPEMQRERLQQREKMPLSLLEKILKIQCQRHTRLTAANDIIHNEGDLGALKQQIISLHHHYLSLV